ncbi:MAG TPA: winged helix-turn-helix domain-containing protein [Kofleriaceae bacterium]|nr:winged helix-turn-helix domain-containing protein [Kofleriaceae bacterium]
MSTLAVVEEILRETAVPMSVREIVERAGARLPSKSKTPDTVVARDLSMDIKKKGESSLFTRTSPGRYTLRTLAGATAAPSDSAAMLRPVASPSASSASSPSMSALPQRKPAAPAPTAPRTRDSDVQGGGFAG